MQWNIATYIEHRRPYARRLLNIRGHTYKVIELDGCQNAQRTAATNFSMEKIEITKVYLSLLVHKVVQ